MTIESAHEFVRLRTSSIRSEQQRAFQEDATESVWLEVIQRDPELRFWVAQNKTIPVSVLARLATDPDPRIRALVASKRKLDAGLFELLVADPDAGVRHRVAYNRKAPLSIIEALADDPDQFVRDAARKRIEDR